MIGIRRPGSAPAFFRWYNATIPHDRGTVDFDAFDLRGTAPRIVEILREETSLESESERWKKRAQLAFLTLESR